MKNEKVIDKHDCFAWLSKEKCNALSIKKCDNCSFYRHHTEVKDYQKYLPKGFKRKK